MTSNKPTDSALVKALDEDWEKRVESLNAEYGRVSLNLLPFLEILGALCVCYETIGNIYASPRAAPQSLAKIALIMRSASMKMLDKIYDLYEGDWDRVLEICEEQGCDKESLQIMKELGEGIKEARKSNS